MFCGAAKTVTGSMYLLETDQGNILVDCGFYQGRRQQSKELNRDLPSKVFDADAMVLTHAHIDHSGSVPTLVKRGFDGPIYTTPATADLCQHMFRDSARIQMHDAEYLNQKNAENPDWEKIEPLYTEKDAIEALSRFVTYHYWRPFEPFPGVRIVLSDAGHVLGSANVLIEAEGKKVLFSGDIGRKNMPILRDPAVPSNVDYVVMESTYGDREHGPIGETQDELARIINETAKKKGKVIIPSFALERTQEIVLGLNNLRHAGKIDAIPIYVDSPLATNLTHVFKNHPECYDENALKFLEEHGDPFGFDSLVYTQSVNESIALNSTPGPMVIISASGMCEAGRIVHHLRNNIESPNNTIVIVGFQAQHTLGRRIVEKREQVKIFGVNRDLRARVEVLSGFSAHAGRSELIEFAKLAGPNHKRVFLVHGEEESQESLAEALRERHMDVVIPSRGQIETF
ncbi:MAG: MBL fold metallo-hydrolase [bacterium]